MPAVSIRLYKLQFAPPLMNESTESLVVPGISDTIDLVLPVNTFKMEDLPAFGRPMIATLIVSLIKGKFTLGK